MLITYADCDAGYWRARELLNSGCRVVVTARHVSSLTQILLGERCSQLMAVAADIEDPTQRSRLVERARARLGRLTWVVDGRSGALTALRDNEGEVSRRRPRPNGTRMVAQAACDPKTTDKSHISSLASG
ncbi:SDR family NAD(P)-dependent oxidoreductase [Mycobacterium sp. MMS18-G62]